MTKFVLLSFLLILSISPVYSQSERITSCECPFEKDRFPDSKVFCGKLRVPENRDDPESRQLDVMFAVITPDNALPDPVVLLPGGPGGAPVGTRYLTWIHSYMPQNRTFIAFDPRGTGLTGPIMCPEQNTARSMFSAMDLTLEEERKMKTGAILACRSSLKLQDIDISMYNSVTIAQDVYDLMTALGYDKWNLYGGSYGVPHSRMIMRLYPQNLRAVAISDGGDIDMRRFMLYDQRYMWKAIQDVFRRCSEDPDCHASYPDLEDEFYNAYDGLKKIPLTVQVSQEEFDFPEFTVNSHEFVQFVYWQLFNESRLIHLPALIHAFAMRDPDVVARAMEFEYGSPSRRSSSGMSHSVECFDHYQPGSYERQVEFGKGLHPAFREVPWFNVGCEVWLTEATDEKYLVPFKSNIPTLILHGEHDPMSTRDIAETHEPWFPNLHIVTTPDMAHGPPSPRELDCWKEIISQFFENPQNSLDDSCARNLPPVRISTELPEWAIE